MWLLGQTFISQTSQHYIMNLNSRSLKYDKGKEQRQQQI